MFCSPMFSLQNSLRKIAQREENGDIFLLCLCPTTCGNARRFFPSNLKCQQPPCFLHWAPSSSWEGSVGCHAWSFGPERSPPPAQKTLRACLWNGLGGALEFKDFSNEGLRPAYRNRGDQAPWLIPGVILSCSLGSNTCGLGALKMSSFS